MITEAQFRALAAEGYNRIPLVLETYADLDTPLSLYLKLANARYSFLLESVVGGERFGRYSFIGLPAKVRLRARGRHIDVEDDTGVRESSDGRSARVRRGVPRALPRGAAARAPALLRRARRHLRLRRRPPHRAQARAHGEAAHAGSCRRTGSPAAADRGARGRRQPEGQDLADRLRGSGRSPMPTRSRGTGCRRCAAGCASRS